MQSEKPFRINYRLKSSENEKRQKEKNNIKFELSNKFPLDFGQIARILQALSTQNKDKKSVLQNLADELGLPYRRIRGLCSLCVAMGLLIPRKYELTEIGKLVADYDPFFDSIGTLWLCHYILSYDRRWIVWNVIINEVVYKNHVIEKKEIKKYFSFLKNTHYSGKLFLQKLSGEVNVLLDAYTQQSFHRLNYLQLSNEKFLANKNQLIPELIILAAILLFREKYESKTPALQIQTMATAMNSPGRVFNMEENDFRELLGRLHKKGYIFIESSADLDQIRLKNDMISIDVIKDYYEGVEHG